MATGTVFNIQRFSINDGPGIRTTVFFKGCPLRCAWCHNPEGLSPAPQILYSAGKCAQCRACAAVCPRGCHTFDADGHRFAREKCASCGLCAEACVFEALEKCGRSETAEETFQTVLRDAPFYKTSGGGMTLSGGEPLMQPEFAAALIDLAEKNGVHTCVETSGAGGDTAVRAVLGRADLVLLDIKHTDPEALKRYTGLDWARWERSFAILREMGKPVVLRCPIIPGVNDAEAHFRAVAEIAEASDNVLEVNVMPYHALGEGKRVRLTGGEERALFTAPSPETAAEWVRQLQRWTKKPTRLG